MAASLVSKRPGKCCRPEGAASAAPKTYRPPTTQDPAARGPRSPLPPPHRQAEGVGPAASMGTSLPTGGGSGVGAAVTQTEAPKRPWVGRAPEPGDGTPPASNERQRLSSPTGPTRASADPGLLPGHGPRRPPRAAGGDGEGRGQQGAPSSDPPWPVSGNQHHGPRGAARAMAGGPRGVARATAGGPRGWRGPRQAHLRPTAGRVCSVTSKEDADSRKTKGLSYCGAEVTCWPRSPLNEAARDSIGDSSYMSL